MPQATDADTDADYGGADDANLVLDYGQSLGGVGPRGSGRFGYRPRRSCQLAYDWVNTVKLKLFV